MKTRVVTLIAAVLVLALAGCDSKEAKRKSAEANVLMGAYVQQMDAGKTTPEQDKALIRAIDKQVYQFDAALRGTANAAATRALVKSPAPVKGGQ